MTKLIIMMTKWQNNDANDKSRQHCRLRICTEFIISWDEGNVMTKWEHDKVTKLQNDANLTIPRSLRSWQSATQMTPPCRLPWGQNEDDYDYDDNDDNDNNDHNNDQHYYEGMNIVLAGRAGHWRWQRSLCLSYGGSASNHWQYYML